jgi:hypothetical protein
MILLNLLSNMGILSSKKKKMKMDFSFLFFSFMIGCIDDDVSCY